VWNAERIGVEPFAVPGNNQNPLPRKANRVPARRQHGQNSGVTDHRPCFRGSERPEICWRTQKREELRASFLADSSGIAPVTLVQIAPPPGANCPTPWCKLPHPHRNLRIVLPACLAAEPSSCIAGAVGHGCGSLKYWLFCNRSARRSAAPSRPATCRSTTGAPCGCRAANRRKGGTRSVIDPTFHRQGPLPTAGRRKTSPAFARRNVPA